MAVPTMRPLPRYSLPNRLPPQKQHPVGPLPTPPSATAPTPVLRRAHSYSYPPAATATRTYYANAALPSIPSDSVASRASCASHHCPTVNRLRRASVDSQRRASIKSNRRIPSASFLNLTPTSMSSIPSPSPRAFSSSFVAPLADAPRSAVLPNRSWFDAHQISAPGLPSPGLPPVKTPRAAPRTTLGVFRSFTGLNRLAKEMKTPKPISPRTGRSQFKPRRAGHPSPASSTRSRNAASKRGKSAARFPPASQLATDAALLQLMDGGSLEHATARALKKQAKAQGARKNATGMVEGVAAPYRGARGAIYVDADEEWESAPLLPSEAAAMCASNEWVRFDLDSDSSRKSTISTLDSDIVCGEVVLIISEQPTGAAATTTPGVRRAPSLPLLALPARQRRSHLRTPTALVLQPDSFVCPPTPRVPATPRSARRVRYRRRPAPLTLAPASPLTSLAVNPATTSRSPDDFLCRSFLLTPSPRSPARRSPRVGSPTRRVGKKGIVRFLKRAVRKSKVL